MFYSFRQNNPYGIWKDPAIWVIVEADSVDEANRIAQDNGVYFDGCADEIDCPCCGDRWSRQWSDEIGMKDPGCYGSGDLLEDELLVTGDYTCATHAIFYKEGIRSSCICRGSDDCVNLYCAN